MRAFLSVSDKTGLVEFAKGLEALGVELISTGGTAKALRESGVSVADVSSVTNYPEFLGGRVKTLHPAVHGGILADRDDPAHMQALASLGIQPIDLVVVNLYPFRKTISKPGCSLEDAVENIDIGGPSMLRGAAKNYRHVAIVTDSGDYGPVLDALRAGGTTLEQRFVLAAKVFMHTAAYDALIAQFFREKADAPFPSPKLTLTFDLKQTMRYGENPHQSSALYGEPLESPGSLILAEQLQGKELSFNNINDANGALDLLSEFDATAVVAVKHANPCGVAEGNSITEAYLGAFECDPVSIYGGIVACNACVDALAAERMAETFLEIIVAPDFTDEALKIFSAKKNLRVLRLPSILSRNRGVWDYKRVTGGLLVQQKDNALSPGDWECVTEKAPAPEQMADLMFAWKVVKHVKSNGIAVAKGLKTLGLGAGQTNRIWAVEHALARGGARLNNAVLASDAYFPFDDCVRAAAKANITAIVQPGGSIRDKASIDACNELGVAMMFTHMRHFKH